MLVLAAARNEVPSCIVKAAAQNNLVCDGRLVVDAAFRTNDPKIFAAGTFAKFSRRSGMQAMSSYLCDGFVKLPICCKVWLVLLILVRDVECSSLTDQITVYCIAAHCATNCLC